jgi:aquaporin Z
MKEAVNPIRTISVTPAERWRQVAVDHLPEYGAEAACLALFMFSACVFGVLLQHPASTINHAIESPVLRRAAMGLAMGLTAVTIIRSSLGQRSGAHMNPAVTLSFLMLGKVRGIDAVCYVVSQFIGGIIGVAVADFLIGLPLRHMAVNYVVTQPGTTGLAVAFIAEVLISFFMMGIILATSNHRVLSRSTPLAAGFLIANFITWESPYSGMSMNPARTFGSAFSASDWTAIWVYFTAPVIAMLAAAWVYRQVRGNANIYCAKLHHHNNKRCIFFCRYGAM